MSEKPAPKFGAGHLQAFMRQGTAEVRNALYPDSNVVERHTETGIYGTATPGEVGQQREADPQSPTLKDSPLGRFLDAAASKPDREKSNEQREPEMERD